MSTIRNQYQEQFAKLKATYQETGSIVGASTAYNSDDGNVKISIQGMQAADGRQFVDVKFAANGQEAASLQRQLSGGLDATTGLPVPSDTRYGSIGLNGSDFVASAGDLDALAQKFSDITLKTQAEQDAETPSWSYGDKTFTSVDDYHAFMRVEQAAWDAAETIAGQTLLDTGKAPSTEFVIKLQKAMTAAMRGEGGADLQALLKEVPEHAIQSGMKVLNSKNENAARLIDFLHDYLTASREKSKEARTDLVV